MSIKTRRLKRSIATKQQYEKYFGEMTKAGKEPMTYYHWKQSGRQPTYYKGVSKTRPEAKLRRKQRKRLGMKD